MNLKSIRLEREGWGVNKGKLVGDITVDSERGEIKVAIDPEKAAAIITILADALIATTQDTAKLMRAQIIEQAQNGVPMLVEKDAA